MPKTRRQVYLEAWKQVEEDIKIESTEEGTVATLTSACSPQQLFDFGATYGFQNCPSLDEQLRRRFGIVDEPELEYEQPGRWL
ncbi:hypothetical protein CL618_00180 [archaeon]|nr:hypothetical protein [archaeon]|tara:strand:+ start:58 stop:306 length:249 start_codon:yes stop_codon:yes gene_type:complete